MDEKGNIEWNKTYGGDAQDRAYSLIETSDEGYALAGSTWSFGPGKDDFWLIKTDRYGNLEWNKTYGGVGSESASSLAKTSDEGFVLAGGTFSGNYSDPDFWLVKIDANGNMEWNQTYNYNSLWSHANFVFETADEGFAIAGIVSIPPPVSLGEFWLIKTDANGNMEWNKTYGETVYSLIKTSDGGFALAGEDFRLVKTDSYGNIEWSQTHSGSEDDIARSLVETSDGGYVITGSTTSFGAGGTDFWLIKTDEYGNIPEFPAWAILPIFSVLFISVFGFRNKLQKREKNEKIGLFLFNYFCFFIFIVSCKSSGF
jgi:hypothetical protein